MKLPGIRQQAASYERLSAQDASFLAFESNTTYMHVGGVTIFEGDSFRLADGRLDVEQFRRFVTSRLASVPRYRQRVTRIPLIGRPVWVDDPAFRIEDHITELQLEAPGDESALRRASSAFFSQRLDRRRPLWQMRVVQGFADRSRFVILVKAHHAMVDGVAGMDFLTVLLHAEPTADIPAPVPYRPLAAPSRLRLAYDEVRRLAAAPVELAGGIRDFVRSPATRRGFFRRAWALTLFIGHGLIGSTNTSLNQPSTGASQHGWLVTDRTKERAIRSRLGGSRDDVALAVATGAVRSRLAREGVRISRLRIKAMAPINVRTRSERGQLGNRVGMLMVPLPIRESDPRRRLERIGKSIARLRETGQDMGASILAQIDRWTGTLAQRSSMWLATRVRAFSVVVTNVPGPPVPLYALESRLVAIYPLAPTFAGEHINIAALTYLGNLHWGVHYGNGDAAGLEAFVADLEASFEELAAVASATPPRISVVVESDLEALPEAAGLA